MYPINTFIMVAVWAQINQDIIRFFSLAHPLLIIGGTAVLTGSLFFLVCYINNRRYRLKKDREISRVVSQFVEERSQSESILAELDIGVLAFSSDGMLINVNPAAKKMIAPAKVPEKFKSFMDEYGHDNGLQAALLLGSESISAKKQINDKVLRIRLKETRFEQERSSGALIVLQDITEQELEERQRKEFVANVSHELKTPLTTIITYSESLLDWGLSEKNKTAISKDVWRIHDDALRMERLVEDLLLLSSIDSRGIRVRMELLSFPDIVKQVVDRLQHQAHEKEIEMTCYVLSKIPTVFVDRTSMERVLTNLVCNAIKYTDKNGSIKIYVSYLVDDVYVKISDTGFGIEKEHLPRIFNRFYRVDMTGSRMYGGTGLGLSIARELVELHGGHIDVNSVLGKGTEFTVMIPIARKVLYDTLERVEDQAASLEPLYRLAASELQEHAKTYSFIEEQLDELDKQSSDNLINSILEQDDNLMHTEKHVDRMKEKNAINQDQLAAEQHSGRQEADMSSENLKNTIGEPVRD